MSPDYQPGEVVVFSPLEVQRYGVTSGKDYAIQLDGQGNNENTFKRVFLDPKDESVFLLKCVNPKFKSQSVKRERVCGCAGDLGVVAPAQGRVTPPASPNAGGRGDADPRPGGTVTASRRPIATAGRPQPYGSPVVRIADFDVNR